MADDSRIGRDAGVLVVAHVEGLSAESVGGGGGAVQMVLTVLAVVARVNARA